MQQINLYHDSIAISKVAFPAIYVAYCVALLIVGLSAVSAYQQFELSTLQDEVKQLKQQQNKLTTDIATLANSISTQDTSVIENQLVKKETELEHKQFLLQTLKGRSFGNKHGFAEHFAGFARRQVDGVWMTEFHIYAGGQNVNIKGRSLKPELVPVFLQSLSEETSFNGIKFDSFLLEQTERSYIDFILISELVTGQDENALDVP